MSSSSDFDAPAVALVNGLPDAVPESNAAHSPVVRTLPGRSGSKDALIELRNVGVRFRSFNDPIPRLKHVFFNILSRKNRDTSRENWLYRDLSLSITHGTRLGIIGRNGAGKSTLLKLICGIYRPTLGQIRVRGRVAPLIELGAGMIAELPGEDNIVLNGTLMGFSRAEMRGKVDSILDFAGLNEYRKMPVKYYSSGMAVRLAFATATEVNPEILLLDELFASGDAEFIEKSRARMMTLIDRAHIMVLVSHSMELIDQLCNRCIRIEHGKVVADGTPKDVIRNYTEAVESHPAGA